MNSNQAHLQPYPFLFNSCLHFNPTPTFLGVTSDCTFSFSKQVSLLKAKLFPCPKALHCISASSWDPFKESLSLQPLFTYASPSWFPFLSISYITKVEHLHQVASYAITSCLSSCPLPLLLSEVSLLPLRVI